MHVEQPSVGWSLWLQWVTANIVGELVAQPLI